MKKMGFLSCYRSSKSIKKDAGNKNWRPFASLFKKIGSSTRQRNIAAEIRKYGTPKVLARSFSYKELVIATDNFNLAFMIGEGGFGRVYKGYIESIDQVVAVKQLDRNGLQGSREFFAEILMLSMVQHPNLVKLIGYCAEGHERVLVYEYMPNGSLENHLLDLPSGKTPLDWNTRLKIAEGTAKGVEYLHDFADPPVIYRDFKASNILLDADFNPKLSDFGLATLGGMDHVSTRVMGTYGYCAPEYVMSGKLTKKSDVYSYGVVFLEIITGRRAIDFERASGEQNMIAWAEPLFRDKHKFTMMADPLLEGDYPRKGLYQALAVAATCLQEEPESRPSIGDVVTALQFIVRKNDHETTPSESTNKITYVNSMKRASSTRRKLEVSYSSVA